jgi:hypothetical protein
MKFLVAGTIMTLAIFSPLLFGSAVASSVCKTAKVMAMIDNQSEVVETTVCRSPFGKWVIKND